MSDEASCGQLWPLGRPRRLQPGQRTEIWIASTDGQLPQLVHTDHDRLFEAPNWSPDGQSLLLNGDGALWRLDLEGASNLLRVDLVGVPPLNNDHVIDPTTERIYVSANDGHIWVAPLIGGTATRVTSDPTRYHFLHGVSPDGATLAFVEIPAAGLSSTSATGFGSAGRLALLRLESGNVAYPEAGTSHLDGPEFSPDAHWIYLNTEEFTSLPGHAQLARLALSDGRLERVLSTSTVDWFPHLSPDGKWATYLQFPSGTLGHPANLSVSVELVRTADWADSFASYSVFGGQGTLNVNSWSPDSHRFAFVAYPFTA